MTTTETIITAYCANCNDDRDFELRPVERSATIRGRPVIATVPAFVCPTCGHDRDDPDNDPMVALYAAYRGAAGLLRPDEIRAMRETYGLSQESFANVLGMSPASIARYETGALQDEAHDNLIRACRNPDFLKERVERHRERLGDRQYSRFEEAVAASSMLPSPPSAGAECRDEFTGNRRFVAERFIAMAHLLCELSGPTFTTKLNKLAFYCDFIAFAKLGMSISGSSYRKIQHGPVPKDYDSMLAKMEENRFIKRKEIDFGDMSGVEVSAGELPPQLRSVLTSDETKVVRGVVGQFKGWSSKKIRTYSHRETAYTKTKDRRLISYAHATQLQPLMPAPRASK